MDPKELLTQRFTEAIKKSFKPCPLIGPKWFVYNGNAKPPYFQFAGVKSLAKATTLNQQRVADRIVSNLDTNGLEIQAEISEDCRINVKFNKPPDAS